MKDCQIIIIAISLLVAVSALIRYLIARRQRRIAEEIFVKMIKSIDDATDGWRTIDTKEAIKRMKELHNAHLPKSS